MESYYSIEEELITKMHTTFTHRFNLDNFTAAELAIEILEILRVSNSDLSDSNSLYLH